MSRTGCLILLLLFLSKTSFGQPCVNGMQGIQTIGPSGQYPSLTVAFDSLRSKGVSGPVILELQTNYNSSAEIFPVKFTKIRCADSVWNIVIRPQAGATGLQLTSNDPTATIDFNNGKFITIDGRSGGTGGTSSLTITNSNTSGSAIRLINDASWNNLKFLDIRGVNSSSFNAVVFITGTDSVTGNDYNRIDTCRIYSGSTAAANLVYSYGTIFKPNTGLTITGCELFDFFSRNDISHGIYIGSNNEKVSITGNSVYQTSPRDYLNLSAFTNVYGIRILTISQGGHIIKDNFIGGTQKNAGGAKMRMTGTFNFKGISISNDSGITKASLVENNLITKIYMHNSANGGDAAMLELGFTDFGDYRFNGNCINNTIGTMTGDSAIIYRNSGNGFFTLRGLSGASISGLDSVNIRLNKIGGLYIDSTSSGTNTLWGLSISPASPFQPFRCLVEGNTIGSPTVPNSLLNGGRYNTAGIILLDNPQQSNLIIRSNTICNLTNRANPVQSATGYVYGIQVAGFFPVSLTITKNKIYNLRHERTSSPAAYPVAGIASYYAGTTPTIYTFSENEIYNLYTDNFSSAGGPFLKVMGLYLDETSTTSNMTINITRNYIHGLNASTSTYANSVIGIYLDQRSNKANVENNMIRLGIDTSGNSYNESVDITGIYELSGITNKYFHNTVVIMGSNQGRGSIAFHTNAPAATNRIIKNNIFVNLHGNSTDTLPRNNCIFIAPSTLGTPSINLDHNSYYFDKPSGAMGVWPGFEIKTFLNWKAITQKDSNSIFTNPNFVDSSGPASGGCIHIKSPTAIEGRGSSSFTTLVDFDGELRNNLSPVDIGADAGNFLQIEPRIAPSNIQTANISSTSATISITRGDGSNRLFVIRRDNPITNSPIDGQGYLPNTNFGSGSNLGNSTFVVADTGSSVIVNNLAAGSTYHVSVFEFNGANTSANYLTSGTQPTSSFTTQAVTGVIDLQSADYSASVFPNPGKTFWITIQSRRSTVAQVSLYSLTSEHLFTEYIPVNNGNNIKELERIKKYPKGVYILKMSIGKSRGTARLIKF